MKKVSKWKKTVLLSCASGMLVFGGVMQTDITTVWALPSSGESVSGNIVVRDNVGGSPVGSLNEGQKVTIRGQKEGTDGYNWYEITFDWNGAETEGWVRSDLINTGSSESEGSAQGNEENENTEGESEDGDFQIGANTYDIAGSIPQDDIPGDFSETTITYAGEEVPAVKFEYADLFLLYLQNVSDADDAGFYVFDSERDSVIPFILEETKNGYVILMNVPGEIAAEVSGQYLQSDCSFENGSVMAYQLQEADDYMNADAAISDFYYMYGITQSGESGWYLYDAANETLQRSLVSMQYEGAAQADDTKAASPISFDMDSITRMLVAGLGLFCLLLLVLVIIFSVRYRRLRKFLEDECDEEEAEETFIDEEEPKDASDTKELEKKLERHQEKIPDKMFEINLPNGKVDLMDLDEEDGYDVKVERDADYDLNVEDILKYYNESEPEYYDEPEDEPEVKMADSGPEIELTDSDSGDEPEYYDDEEDETDPVEESQKEEKESEKQDSEWDDELEFL